MLRAAAPIAGLIVMTLAGCGSSREEPPARLTTTEGNIGPVTYRYDPGLLTAADVRVSLPVALGHDMYAVKLLPARGVEGSPDLCPNEAEGCPVELQPGLTLALLEQPYELYAEALSDSNLASAAGPATVAGEKGLAVDGGTEDGLKVEYRLVPVDNRALLIIRQRDDQSPEEKQALDDVVASLDLGG